jgi:hypothetical protein
VSIETSYKDCSLASTSTQGIRDQIRIPQGGLLEVSPESGGGRPAPTGQPVRPAAPAAPVFR